ncbi:rod shape-determining protein [Patescibacteria group bacterium]|nr:rod shape-determining protein [Patescibacteria group bacterium]MBU1868369.1 rod shape-determining protein [Patescibacteria group bacterium]
MFQFSKLIGIDLGTANSHVYVKGQGVVLNEPTVVAITAEEGQVIAVGNEAKEMLGRTPLDIVASRPMRDGVIADYAITEAMLRYFLDKVCGSVRIFKPEVMIAAPAGITSVERRAVLDATLSAGAKTAYLIDEALAAAIGAGIPIAEASGHLIVDIGGGTTDVAVISLGGIVVHDTARVAGNRIDEAIASAIRREYNLIIGERMAEEVKIKIGSALPLEEDIQAEVKGRDAVAGLPKVIKVNASFITEAITPRLKDIISTIKSVLEQTPPELSSDIAEKGIILSGGTCQLRNLDRLITRQTGVPAYVVDDPMMCVVKGTGVAIENLDKFKRNVIRR